MEQNNSLEQIYFTEIKKELNMNTFMAASLCVVAGFVLFYIVSGDDPGSNLNILRIVSGISLFIVAFCLVCFRGSRYVYLPTQSPVTRHSINFDSSEFFRLKKLMDGLSVHIDMEKPDSVKMELYNSRDMQFAVFRLFRYDAMMEWILTDYVILSGDEAGVFLTKISNKK